MISLEGALPPLKTPPIQMESQFKSLLAAVATACGGAP